MRKVAATLLVVALANSYALGGTVDFGAPQSVVVGAPDMTATFPVSVIPASLDSMVSLRVIFESAELFLAPPAGGPNLPATGTPADLSLGSAFTPDGQVGFPGVPVPGFEPSGFLGNFGIAVIDLNGTTSGDGVDFQVANDLQNPLRPELLLGLNQPILIGQLTVDAAGLDVGTYTVETVGLTKFANLSGEESLSGGGVLNVTPEPATLMLLGIGGVAVLRRRRTA